MRLAVITDTHFGVKNSSDLFLAYQERFLREEFFPYCKKNGISTILHAGDFFDNRKFMPVKTIHWVNEVFMQLLVENDMTLHMIPGNHDVVYKNTNRVCSTKEFFGDFRDRVTIYMTPQDVEFDGMTIGMLPWITTDNYSDSMEFIRNSSASMLISHLELCGFEMMKGAPVTSHGMDHNLLSRFEQVLTGHFHTKSERDNITYLGCPYELTWADADDPKFFHILDTETRSLTPIRTNLRMFNKLSYSDYGEAKPLEYAKNFDIGDITGTYVKIVVVSKADPYAFDKFVERVQAASPHEIRFVETSAEFMAENMDDEVINIADTPTLLRTCVDAVETDLDKDRLKLILQGLFVEAQTLES